MDDDESDSDADANTDFEDDEWTEGEEE